MLRCLPTLLLGALLLGAPACLFAQKTNPPKTTKPAAAPANPAASAGKPPARDTAVVNLFDAKANLQWIRFFRGRLDDATEVLLSLGFDGSNCRGYLSYAKSQERFRLSGTLEGVVLILEEYDRKNAVSGHLTGSLQGEQMEAEWTNASNTLGSRFEAKEVPTAKALNIPCGDNKWIRRFVSRWNNGRVDLVLARVNNNILNGYLWIETDDKTYALAGKIFPDEHYEIQAILPNGKTAAHLQGSMKTPSANDCKWIGSGEKREIKLTMRENYVVGCLEYADYTSSYDALYPRTRCEACNTSLDRRINDWVTKCKTTIGAQKKPETPANRNALRASAWYDVTCWTETLFCGYLTFAESWKDATDGVSFNFDLRSGKEITYEDLFNKNFNAKEWFGEYTRKEMPKISKFAADPKFREWLAKDGFQMFTIRRDGLELSSQFHPVYGQQHLIVPYSTLKPYMRRDNPIADLVK
ncbi:MAG: hypothetical protein IT260_20320 [Saprospiraceae bacterium]|nr:hypothetical protein [Saprospiraceae bacterium]